MIRITTGKYKNRVIPTQRNHNYRPSTSKIREAIFSILTSGRFSHNNIFPGGQVLDLFAGTGSLAFEALSRGAAGATIVDINEKCLNDAKAFAQSIGEEHNIIFLRLSALALPKAIQQYDLVFIDPPYWKNLISTSLQSLLQGNWLRKGTVIAVESAKTEDFALPQSIDLISERIYGNTKLSILEHVGK
ncbi:MAG: 16S rRNA (guanine(966)-N(2))-methyltransferase RsmD [Rickettsiaceae bacterium]|nr:MAG: 16S rRNA (guanine(966)-N(2))-methyltransferase RsmD [Rickettsiaceae bacterium]